jgi:hypothetical protein
MALVLSWQEALSSPHLHASLFRATLISFLQILRFGEPTYNMPARKVCVMGAAS